MYTSKHLKGQRRKQMENRIYFESNDNENIIYQMGYKQEFLEENV